MKIRVFVIEDNDTIRNMLEQYLEGQGHEVYTAPDPTKCYLTKDHHCEDGHICADLLLVDNQMPNMTGLEFLKNQLKNNCQLPAKNRVLMSANPHLISSEEVERLGIRFLVKPFGLAALNGLISEVIQAKDPKTKLSPISSKMWVEGVRSPVARE